MRKITQQVIGAFYNKQNFSKGNDKVEHDEESGITKLMLHGHTIAELRPNGLFVTSCGYESNTTKERLNGLKGVRIHQSNFVWYLNGEKWHASHNFTRV